ncbi:DUF3040 domain-containing protein [Nonomuraea sp. 3-1Str]|uniref:DUF3040 domain-containing protein n=1 Tax=Nonomuraea sp. 3-1Str TaxID=2929801 RepID=UPI0028554714|nr:DUF3040 domain-containing protein [Nonomuraea sp. 3-1Str]MDR8409653.1 DUF3040 domain-containing protein [Nonomuraea sp. 3-1Str]
MSLSGKERRILAEIEYALALEDPDLARRVAAINSIESGGEGYMRPYGDRARVWVTRHVWLIVGSVVLVVALLTLAVLLA